MSDSGEIRHTIIVFGGWGSGAQGDPLGNTVVSGTSMLVDQIKNISSPGNSKVYVKAFQGAIGGTSGITAAIKFMKDNIDSMGKLIVYGYSVGGIDAIELCIQLDMFYSWHDASKKSFYSRGMFTDKPMWQKDNENLKKVVVDRLITVDASNYGGWGNRKIPRIVKKNLNIYQSFESDSKSKAFGKPTTAMDSTKTEVVNKDWSYKYIDSDFGGAHGKIDSDVIPEVLKEIKTLFYGQIYDYVPPQNGPNRTMLA